MLTKRHIIIAVFVLIGVPVLFIAGVQLATRNQTDDSQVQTGTPVSTVDKSTDGQPTKLAFAQAIAKQAADKGDPATFTPSADKVSQVTDLTGGWYIVDLNVPGLDSQTSIALVKYDAPGTLALKAGPGNHFYADWMKRDGVPDSVSAAMVARNSTDRE